MTERSGAQRVLIVEDDEVTAELERRVLVRAGREVALVRRVADAIDRLQREAFGAVLLDYNLPDGDPWSVVDAAQARLPRVPVIVVTAMGNERIAAEALHHGVAQYLQKSDSFWIQLPELVDKVAREAQAEERVRRSDALFQLIAESANDLVATADLNGVVQEISQACRSMLGYEPEEMIGKPILSFVHPDDRDAMTRSISSKTHLRLTYRALKKDGSHIWVEANASVVRDKENGRPREIVGIVRDIHERKRAEDKFRALLEGSPEANVIIDGRGNITLVNTRAERLFGYEHATLLDAPFVILLPERLRDQSVQLIDQARSPGAIEIRGRRKDGSEFPAELSVSRLETEGELLLSSTFRDVSDRKTLQDQQMLLRMGEQLPRFEDVQTLVLHVASELGSYFDADRCLFTEIDHEREVAIVHGEYVRQGEQQKHEHPIESITPAVRQELETGRLVSISDTAIDLRTSELYRSRYQPLGIRALAAVPLMRHGRWVANFFLAAGEVRHWTSREIQMLQALVERTWLWIEHVRIMRALRDSERKYRHFIEATHEGVWEVDAAARTRFANPRMASMLGYTIDEMLGAPLEQFLDAEGRALVAVMVARRKAGIHESHDFRFRRKDGSAMWARLEASSLTTESGEYDGALAMVADVTEHRQVQADRQFLLELAELLTVAEDRAVALRVAARTLGAHLAVERCLFAEFDDAQEQAVVNEEWHIPGIHSLMGAYPLAPFGEGLEEMIKGRSFMVADASLDPRTAPVYERTYARLGLRASVAVPMHKSGRVMMVLVVGTSRPREWMQREVALVQATVERAALCVERLENIAALRDMSKELERRVDDRTHALKAALKEKEVLLKEIHHRVKNNLQVISSMLNLQAMHITDEAAQSVFAESQGRVQSIALVHETLYESEDLSSVNFVDYIHTLVNTVIQAQSRPERHITTEIEAADIRLAVGSAIPCGLIINELVTNSLKHAFKDRDGGSIRVALRQREQDTIELVVTDDGVGLPTDLDLRRVTSLGLDLVYTFAEQLGAEVLVTTRPGTEFRFVFRDHE